MVEWVGDLSSMDWADDTEWPDGFQPLEAIVLVKGVYQTDDGSLTRPVWCHRWTTPLSRNVYERIGALDTILSLAQDEACSQYVPDGEDE